MQRSEPNTVTSVALATNADVIHLQRILEVTRPVCVVVAPTLQ